MEQQKIIQKAYENIENCLKNHAHVVKENNDTRFFDEMNFQRWLIELDFHWK